MLLGNDERVERMPINPLDKSTVVSIFPDVIERVIPTIQPSNYRIEAGSYEHPAVLVVESASWWRRAVDMPSTEIPTGSMQVARSLSEDYIRAMIETEFEHAEPGLFWVAGSFTSPEIGIKFKARLEIARERQKNWFMNLVKRADIDWTRTQGNPLCISTLSKMAAEQLNLKDKPWMKDFSTIQMVNCPACGVLKNPVYPICANCRTNIDEFVKGPSKK